MNPFLMAAGFAAPPARPSVTPTQITMPAPYAALQNLPPDFLRRFLQARARRQRIAPGQFQGGDMTPTPRRMPIPSTLPPVEDVRSQVWFPPR